MHPRPAQELPLLMCSYGQCRLFLLPHCSWRQLAPLLLPSRHRLLVLLRLRPGLRVPWRPSLPQCAAAGSAAALHSVRARLLTKSVGACRLLQIRRGGRQLHHLRMQGQHCRRLQLLLGRLGSLLGLLGLLLLLLLLLLLERQAYGEEEAEDWQPPPAKQRQHPV